MVLDTTPVVENQFDHWENFTNKRKYDHPVVSFFAKQRIDFISTVIPLSKIKNALDVGSGLGWSSAHFPKNVDMTVTDFSPNQLRHNPIQKQVVCDSEDIPFEDKSFSLVYGWEFLHHVPDPFKTVEEMSRVTSDYLVLLEPNRNNPAMFLYGVLKNHERATLKFHKKMMYQLVKNIKFDILACETVGCTFAGSTPQFMLPLVKKLPYRIPIIGTSNIIICKRKE